MVLSVDRILKMVMLTSYLFCACKPVLNMRILILHVRSLLGLDETSCFFVDEDGGKVEHGYYFDEISFVLDSEIYMSFSGGDYPIDLSRRKVIVFRQFCRLDFMALKLPRGSGSCSTAMGREVFMVRRLAYTFVASPHYKKTGT